MNNECGHDILCKCNQQCQKLWDDSVEQSLKSISRAIENDNKPIKVEVTEGVKYDNNKAPLNLLSNYALEEVSKVLDFGQRKYNAWNWTKGIAYSRVIAAAKRHIAAWENGIDLDEESKTNHLANAMCNLMFLLDYEVRGMKELDDRRPKETLIKKENKKND